MPVVLLVARLLLAAVFAVAALTKLADLAGSRQAMRNFGVPERLAVPLGTLLPIAELAIAITLVPAVSARWTALSALLLLLLFVAGIAYNLARGRTPDCHCFGQLHSSPAGWPTLARNTALAAVAALVVWQGPGDPGQGALAWLSDTSEVERIALAASLVALVLGIAQGWVLVNLAGQNGRLLTRLEVIEAALAAGRVPGRDQADAPPPAAAPASTKRGLPVGAPAPTFTLPGLHGEKLTLESLCSDGVPVLLVFMHTGCGACNTLLPDIARWQREHVNALSVAMISRGSADANRARATKHGLIRLLLQQDREVAEAYRANALPSAVLVRSDGTIGSPLTVGLDAIRALVTDTVGGTAPGPGTAQAGTASDGAKRVPAPAPPPPNLKVGDPVPAVKLVDLAGAPVDLATFLGAPTLLLFWNPAHAGCQAMLPDLKAWEGKPPPGAPKLLVVSTGTTEANREMGLHSLVVLGGSQARRAFGISGGPAAVLLDAEGQIASPVVRGAPSVLDLLRGRAASPANVAKSGAQAPKKSDAEASKTKVGDAAPPVVLPNLTGSPVDLAAFRGAPTLVLFWNPGCGFCKRMLPDLKAWEDDPPEGAPKLLVVSKGEIAQNRLMELKSTVVLDQGFATGRAFGATGTPSAVLLDAEGNIASPIARGAPAVLALANGDMPSPAAPGNGATSRKLEIGEPAPAVKLRDLAGEPIDLAAFRGTPTLVLFWSPGCGHCKRILDEIKTWEANPPEGAPKLFVVSSGDPERNRAMGLRSTVALDPNFSAGQAFGARGTPSAVLLDADGNIASPVATGGPAVLALAGARQHELKSPTP